ncbi:MAG: hypothetical protein J5509_11285 [Lachnospiraceae bacterium]|nr:hypothetical protein [Lachnospiraceae bacterium]
MKHRRTRILVSVLTAIMTVVALTGCGSKAPDGYYVLSEFQKGSETVKAEDLSKYGLDGTYVVMNDGSGFMVIMDTPTDLTFDKDAGVLKTSSGDIQVSASGKNLTLADATIKMIFTKSSDSAPSKPPYPTIKVPEAPGSDDYDDTYGEYPEEFDLYSFGPYSQLKDLYPDVDWDNFDWYSYDWLKDPYDLQSFFENEDYWDDDYTYTGSSDDSMIEYWNDDWYGWWELSAWDSKWDRLEDYKYSIMAKSYLDSDGEGWFYLWDNDGEFADVVCSNNGSGLTDVGTMVSESGTFYEGEIEHADWSIDPGTCNHDDSIEIYGYYYEDDELQFSYTFHLAKWGCLWEDYEEEELPNDWDWYVDLVKAGKPMPEWMPD